MKITDIQKIFANETKTQNTTSASKTDEQFFNANFNDMEGVELERTTPQQDYKKREVEIKKDSNGEETITVYEEDGKDPIEETIKYPNGKIKSKTKRNANGDFENIKYREDGSVYSKGTYKDFYEIFLLNETKYDRKGNIETTIEHNGEDAQNIVKSYTNEKLRVLEVKDARRNERLEERTIYNKDGSIYLYTKYDERGNITESIKNKNKTKTRHRKYKEKDLNGTIDKNFEQGFSGSCYFVSAIQSFMNTTKGKEIINNSVSYNKDTKVATIKFKGVNKEYQVTEDEIEKAHGRLSTGDPDFTALLLAYEKYRVETQDRTIDGGLGSEVIKVLTGEEGETNMMFSFYVPMTNETLDELKRNLDTGNYVITVNTPPDTLTSEMSEENEKNGLANSHACSLKAVTDKDVTYIDPIDQKERTISREQFLSTFITFCKKELK